MDKLEASRPLGHGGQPAASGGWVHPSTPSNDKASPRMRRTASKMDASLAISRASKESLTSQRLAEAGEESLMAQLRLRIHNNKKHLSLFACLNCWVDYTHL
jgi:hypothetical protein